MEEEEVDVAESVGEYDLPSHFFQDVGATAMLTREEEQTIARASCGRATAFAACCAVSRA